MDANKKMKFYLVFNILNVFYNHIVCIYFLRVCGGGGGGV